MTDRPLDSTELDDLRKGKTLTTVPYFITVFKKDVMEPNGRNAHVAPSLYEMVLLEILSKLEVLEKVTTPAYISLEMRKRYDKEPMSEKIRKENRCGDLHQQALVKCDLQRGHDGNHSAHVYMKWGNTLYSDYTIPAEEVS